jgi:hypothetical protein
MSAHASDLRLSNATDKIGDTVSLGLGMTVPANIWHKRQDGSYTGAFIMLSDRGWNTQGTVDNGAPNNAKNLNEKWESIAILPVVDRKNSNDYFLVTGSITTSSPRTAICRATPMPVPRA